MTSWGKVVVIVWLINLRFIEKGVSLIHNTIPDLSSFLKFLILGNWKFQLCSQTLKFFFKVFIYVSITHLWISISQ